jgi:hypothetical protein
MRRLLAVTTIILIAGCSKDNTDPVAPTPDPTDAYLQSITLEAIPWTDQSGNDWDLSSGPDLVLKLLDAQGNVLFRTDPMNDVTIAQLPARFNWDAPGYHVPDWYSNYTCQLWDYDATGDDFIGSVTFQLHSLAVDDGYVSNFTIQNGRSILKLAIKWE